MAVTTKGLYAIGGTQSGRRALAKHTGHWALTSVDIFNGVEWITGPELLSGRSGHSAVVYDDEIYVFGGLGDRMNLNKFNQILVLSNKRNEWEAIGYMLQPVRQKFIVIPFSMSKVWIYGGTCVNFPHPVLNIYSR